MKPLNNIVTHHGLLNDIYIPIVTTVLFVLRVKIYMNAYRIFYFTSLPSLKILLSRCKQYLKDKLPHGTNMHECPDTLTVVHGLIVQYTNNHWT